MRIFKETQIDFLGSRNFAFVLSAVLIGIGIVSLVVNGGPRQGIDFAGGSQIVVRMSEMPDLDELRDALTARGLEGATIQEFVSESNEILIRTPGVEEGEQIDASVAGVEAALDELFEVERGEGMDLNTVGRERLVERLLQANPRGYDLDLELEVAEDYYGQQAAALLDARADVGLIQSWDQLDGVGIDADSLAVIRDASYLGTHAVVNSESVGPQVGRDLRRQTVQAMVWSLVGMLAYISYRFEFTYGVAAVAALAHDVMITLGAFSLTGREFNLPVIAAFLTIVGYSLNDTVVIFDRIRENSTVMRRASLYDRINASINQTLSRTVLTSGTTLIVVASLYLFGGPVINDFAFALLVGVFAGTYSTVYIASPIVYIWQQREAAKRR